MQQNLQQKKGLVKSVFDTVYNKYDLMNDFLSFGIHRVWKNDLMFWMNPGTNKILLDVACGTGDLAKLFHDKTKNLIDYSKLKNMKKEAIIINTARGGIIKEDDLNKALNENIIFGAGLDVFENEPIDKTNPLLSNKKVLLSPHSATFTNECKSRMSLETIKNIIDFFGNKIDKSMIVKL